MNIIPSIDIYEGQCVRLKKGNFNDKKIYGLFPKKIASLFQNEGATMLHIVDLQGAKEGKIMQWEVISDIISAFDGMVQIGGGVRHTADIDRLLSLGAMRVVIGTSALEEHALRWLEKYGNEQIVLALDFHMMDSRPCLAISGWQGKTTVLLWNVLKRFENIKHVLCTDISRDGMQQGANIHFYQQCVTTYPDIAWQASGGISTLEDVKSLAAMNISSAIIGKAFYEKSITFKEAIQSC